MDLKAQLEEMDIKQALFLGIILAVIYYALLFNDGKYIDNSIRQAEDTIMTNQETLSKVEKALENKKRFENEIREITIHMKEFQEFFPANFRGNELEKKVTQFSQKNGLTIVSLKQVEEKNEFKNYPETRLEINVEGEYHKIMNFISQITMIKKAMDFKGMKFSVAQQADDPKIRLLTTIVIYGNSDSFGADNG